MTKIQVIGLPGSGKTTYIEKYLQSTDLDVQHLDIRNFTGRYRDRNFKRAFRSAKGFVIAESACGIPGIGYVIKVDTPIQTVYQQLLERDKELDEEYLSGLGTQMVAADCTLSTPDDLPGVLATILRR
jgi:GTPase SAR1 family protein